MTAHRDPDGLIRAFLREGDDRLQDRVYDVVRAEIEHRPQRSVIGPWRTPVVNKIVGFGLAAAVAVVVLVVGAQLFGSPRNVGSGSEPTPTIQPTGASGPGFSRFTSTMHGISIDYPSGWQIRPATEPWTGGALNFDSPAADVIFDPMLGADLYIVLASRAGRVDRFDEQTDQFRLIDESGVCDDAEGGGGGASPSVDGASAWHSHCGTDHVSAVTTANRGYLIALVRSGDDPALADAYDIDAALETVDLRPDEAQ